MSFRGGGRKNSVDRGEGGSRRKFRRIFIFENDEGERREFASKGALLTWAKVQARQLFPNGDPVVHLTSRHQLYVHPSHQAYTEWVTQSKSARSHGEGTGVMLGRVKPRDASASAHGS